jgi:alpha-L-rhamnosidase
VHVLDSVLGIDISEPGASEVRISAPPTGLTSASGSRMTERGRVATAWTRDGDGLSLEATVPVYVTAVVELPARTEVRLTGPRGAAAERLDTSDGVVRYRIGSGDWTFTAAG